MLHCRNGLQPLNRAHPQATKLRNPMKTSLKLIALLSLGTVAALTLPGCAGTATQESTGEYVDDAAITTKVKAALVKDPIVKARQVDVTTFKGTVQLSGFVDNQAAKDQAARVAAGIQGVTNVTNNISVKAAE